MRAKADRATLLDFGERPRMDSEGKAAQGESERTRFMATLLLSPASDCGYRR